MAPSVFHWERWQCFYNGSGIESLTAVVAFLWPLDGIPAAVRPINPETGIVPRVLWRESVGLDGPVSGGVGGGGAAHSGRRSGDRGLRDGDGGNGTCSNGDDIGGGGRAASGRGRETAFPRARRVVLSLEGVISAIGIL